MSNGRVLRTLTRLVGLASILAGMVGFLGMGILFHNQSTTISNRIYYSISGGYLLVVGGVLYGTVWKNAAQPTQPRHWLGVAIVFAAATISITAGIAIDHHLASSSRGGEALALGAVLMFVSAVYGTFLGLHGVWRVGNKKVGPDGI